MTTAVRDLLPAAVAAGAALPAADAETLAAAQRVVAETIAVAFAGARTPEHAALVARVAEPAGAEPANVVADSPWRAAPQLAAFLNATAAVALELDETLVGGGHPGAHVVPAALAEAQRRGASGDELLEAVARGYETAGRLYRSHRFPLPSHPHGAIGSIGAAVAVAALRDRDPLPAARAAATLPLLPTWSACFEGASARNAWVGLGAMIGVLANDLADAGLEGVTGDPLEAMARVSEPVDREPEDGPLILRSATRLHPVVSPIQSAVEAAAELRSRLPGPPDAVLVETVAANAKFDYLPEPNDLSARFSLPHAVAAALTTPEREDYGFDPAVLDLAEQVRVETADDLQSLWPGTTAARVTVTLGAESLTARCDVPLGHPDRPLDEPRRAARVQALVGRDAIAERLLSVSLVPDLRELLAPGPA